MTDRQECHNCRFMVKDKAHDDYGMYAECRRHAPKMLDTNNATWPMVYVGDWCGDWEASNG